MKPIYAALAVLAAALHVSAFAQDAETTYAEKLGWKKGDRVLIMHIDDAGMSYDSDLGTIKAMTEGVANSVSVMMPCPWVPHFVKWLKENPDKDAGLHLTLTSEWGNYRWGPLVGKPAAPGLVDEEGALWGGVAGVVRNASANEVEMEIRAQIDRAVTMGFNPTHLDSHMGTLFATPEFLERYIKVGIETGIPVMFPGGHNTALREQYRQEAYERVERMNRNRPEDEQIDKEAAAQAALDERFAPLGALSKAIWDGGLPVLDDLHNTSLGWKREEKVEKYVEAIRNLEPGVTMMINHCTWPTEVFDKISGSGESRKGDTEAMIAPEVRKAIEEEGIILTTWRELKERRDAVK